MLQKATTEAGGRWNPPKHLTLQEKAAIGKARAAGKEYEAARLKGQAEGRWVEKQVREEMKEVNPDLQWNSKGVDVVDPNTGLKYETMSGSKSNIDRHAKRMADDQFRFITF